MKQVMIVESPHKAKTISGYLRNEGIRVMASMGHVRGLDTSIKNHGAIEVDNGFRQHFILNQQNIKNTKEILSVCKTADIVYLATDLDTQGESIAWHLKELISKDNKKCEFRRVTYNEVTQQAVKDAIKNYSTLNMNKVESQFALQALDYLVGFNLSPLLWKVVRRGLSAGRVQSPSLRLIVEREKEIKLFVPIVYWQMILTATKDNINFPAKLISINGKSLGKLSLSEKESTREEVDKIKQSIQALVDKGEKLHVTEIKRSKTSSKPKAPYTTSTLQTDAVRKLNWSTTKVMTVAQKLFEGNGGEHGYITYHRTDSVALSDEALKMIFDYGNQHYKEYMQDKPVVYVNRSKNAQEAHEAIRPTYLSNSPEVLSKELSEDEYKLYKLIWERTMASQMKPALYDATQVNFLLGKRFGFRSTGSILVFKGYLSVYQEGIDVDSEKEENARLPNITNGDKVEIKEFNCIESQTKPPARYNEGTLVEELTRLGIGRPSTYATIIKTLQDRGYVRIENKRFILMDVGEVVVEYLMDKFYHYVDYDFTSNLNNKLDEIAEGKLNWKQVMYEFWNPFNELVQKHMKESVKGTGLLEELSEICPKCGQGNLVLMIGKYGKFKSCKRRKECGFIESLTPKQTKQAEVFEGKKCPECGGDLIVRTGFKGRKFLGCVNFSNKEKPCKYSCNADGTERASSTAVDTGVKCPKCKKNNLFIRMARFGKMFSCSGFPKCRNIVKKDDFAEMTGKTLVEVDEMLK